MLKYELHNIDGRSDFFKNEVRESMQDRYVFVFVKIKET